MQDEIWRAIPNWEGLYEISNLGRVKSLPRSVSTCDRNREKYTTRTTTERIMKGQLSVGYRVVELSKPGEKRRFVILVHRAIALAFIPNPEGKPHINHKDGNKQNNDISNLEWCTHQENMSHAHSTGLAKAPPHGKGERCSSAKLSNSDVQQIKFQLKLGHSVRNIAKNYPRVTTSAISEIKAGRSWAHI